MSESKFGLFTLKGTLMAVTPISHGGNEKTGSVSLLNRLRFVTENGIENIPVISGNAVRGYLRRMLMKDLLERAGYTIDVSSLRGQKLYHALFSGGILETVDSKSSNSIDIEMKKKVLSVLPPIRLFGMSYGNQIFEGKLKVGFALPICTELEPFLPEDLPVKPSMSIYTLLSSSYITRKDDLRADPEDAEKKTVQMMVEFEVFSPGTVFYHEFKLEDPSEIDLACLGRCIELWKTKPYIGGRSSSGMGELRIDYGDVPDPKPYLEFIESKKERISEVLEWLEKKG